MIYTFTLNPAVDYYISLPTEIMWDEVNRGTDETYKAGGKGLNVSKVLSLLGIPSTAVCLLGGFTVLEPGGMAHSARLQQQKTVRKAFW